MRGRGLASGAVGGADGRGARWGRVGRRYSIHDCARPLTAYVVQACVCLLRRIGAACVTGLVWAPGASVGGCEAPRKELTYGPRR